ncbi:LysE family translocator [Roseibium salinum]|uniref:LysE family translocator n=1 Tax=Roseibium salinum TaxID=1604349 RepID=A0ABT3R383_9HYPH|nr:LysE family translocator [Roseibium sp. DSM 29163]MCX2723714.1 LysE family translocator [Roseibium sp. DSM 29163]
METIAPYVPGLLLVYSAFLLAVMSPGPGVLALMGTSMHSGRKAGVCFAVGIVLGSITWGTLTVAGLSVVMAKFGYLLFLIKIFGGCYLLWMACKAFRSATTRQELAARVAPASLKPRQLILRGYLVMLTNPKAIFSWIAIVSLGIQNNAPWWLGVVLVSGTTTLSFLVNMSYALLFSTSVMLRAYARARRSIQAVLGTFFAFAGVKMITSA